MGPILQFDIRRLEHGFWSGYRGRDRCFYVSTTNDQGGSLDVTDELGSSWNEDWLQRHEEFEAFLSRDLDLSFLSNKLFCVWDGNHRLMSWVPYIASKHSQEFEVALCS